MVKKNNKVNKSVSKPLSGNNSFSNVSSHSVDSNQPLKPILSKRNSRDLNGSKNVTFQGESAKKRNSLGSKNVSVTEEIDSDDDKFPLNLSNTSDNLIEIGSNSENEDSEDDYEFLLNSSASDDEDDSDDDDILGSLWVGEDDDDDESDEDDKPSTVVFEEITEKENSQDKTENKLVSLQAIIGRTSLKRKRDDSPVETPSNKRIPTEKQATNENLTVVSKLNTSGAKKSKFQEKLAQLKKDGKTLTKKEAKKLKKSIKAQERKKNAKKPKVAMSATRAEKFLASIKKRQEELQSRSIYLRPIPRKCDYILLNEAFPDMTGCHIPLKLSSKHKKVPRGFAFVEFSSTKEAEKHLKQLQTAEHRQNILKVLYPTAKTRPSELIVKTAVARRIKTNSTRNEVNKEISRYDLTKLHVSGLPAIVNSQLLHAVFDGCKRIDLPSRKNGSHFGFCVAEFQDEFKAKNAFWHCHGKNVNNAPLTVTFVIKRRKKD